MTHSLLRRPVLVASAGTTLVALAGGLATDLGPWYGRLILPPWKPPDWAFGPVWTTIFVLTTIAIVRSWQALPPAANGARTRLVLAAAVNGVLNILWSVLFFALHRPDWALREVAALWLSIPLLMLALRPGYPRAPRLLVPYLAWVSVAAAMNAQIVADNPPFGPLVSPAQSARSAPVYSAHGALFLPATARQHQPGPGTQPG